MIDPLGPDRAPTTLTGVLGPWTRHLTKTGNAWAAGTLLVDDQPVPFQILPATYTRVGGQLREDEPVTLVGTVDRRPDIPLLSVQDVQ